MEPNKGQTRSIKPVIESIKTQTAPIGLSIQHNERRNELNIAAVGLEGIEEFF